MIGEVRFHKKRGLYYVYEFHPTTENLTWLRLDTFVNGKLRTFPLQTAKSSDLKKISEELQNDAVHAFRFLDMP